MRLLAYDKAIDEAHNQILTNFPESILIGQGLTSPWYVGKSAVGLPDKYGKDRVIDCQISETSTTGVAVGAALTGLKPIILHPRMDFFLLAADPIINQAANWSYMTGGNVNCPVVVRAIVNRGGEQAAQHSQNLATLYMHIPGLKVVMPYSAYDAKGMLIASVLDGNPVIYIDDRWLYPNKDEVPEEMYTVPLGKGITRNEGDDVSIITISYMVKESLEAAEKLAKEGISAEVVDLRSLKPLDKELILKTVKKTKRLVIAEGVWKTAGWGAEVIATIAESSLYQELKTPVVRVSLPNTPAPCSTSLENTFYKTSTDIMHAVKKTLHI
jgi:pyruvate/2-oxoglutarate/acetoin dehydrogenase E1 component